MTPGIDKVFVPGPGRVFVFGSNLLGQHGGGAARTAWKQYGARWGVGEGLTGDSYAFPTCYAPGCPLPLDEVREVAARFLAFAETRPDLAFFVTRVGCGLAGFTDAQIAPLLSGAPENCELPHGWRDHG